MSELSYQEGYEAGYRDGLQHGSDFLARASHGIAAGVSDYHEGYIKGLEEGAEEKERREAEGSNEEDTY